MEKIDSAFETFKKLLLDIKNYDDSIYSEQDTRIKIIDRVLVEVLEYDYKNIITEPKAGKGFIDYKISVNDIPKLIIEAKKDGLDFDIDQNYSGRAFNLNGPVFKDKAVQDGLEQCIYYAAHKSVELTCLTNGKTWIVFRGNRIGDGKDVMDGKAIVFSTLECVQKNFKLFFELLSPEAIFGLKYRAIFQEQEGIEIRRKEFSKALKTENNLKAIDRSNHSHDFDKVMTEFFSKLSGDSDPDLLTDCFVETKESQIADKELFRISEELANRVKSLETTEAAALKTLIERVKTTNRHEFVILIGSKGAGKSTFIDRFFKNVLNDQMKEQCIVVRINLGESDGNVNTIIDWLNQTLLEECEKVLFDGKPTFEEIQGLHWHEYDRLSKGNWRTLYETNKDQFKIDFGKHIESRRETRPNEYIKRLIGDITKSRFKVPCIIFDNTDHFSIDFQETVFQYARGIYEKEICLIIVPITDKTSWQLSKQGAIQSFENEVLFLPVPSPRKIIEKRIQYLEQKIEVEQSNKGQYFLQRGIKLEISNIHKFVKYLQNIFLSDNLVAKWIGEFANYDIRRCLDLTRDLISSPYISIEELFLVYAAKVVQDETGFQIKREKIKTALIKRFYNCYPIGRHTYIQNLFYFTGNINESPIFAMRVLQVLIDKRNDQNKEDNYLAIDQILDYFNGMSVDRSITAKHLDLLLKKGLLQSYDPTILDIGNSKKVEITPSGMEHYHWCLNENDYLHIMAEVTPITDKNIFSVLESNYYYPKTRNLVMAEFITYLEANDLIYCHIPDHIAYGSQVKIMERLIQRRKQINEWISK